MASKALSYDKKIIEKILFGAEQLTRADNEITLVNIKFDLNACKNLSKKELDNLSDAEHDFFYFIQSVRSKLKLHDFVNIWMVLCNLWNFSNILLRQFV